MEKYAARIRTKNMSGKNQREKPVDEIILGEARVKNNMLLLSAILNLGGH